MRPSRPQSPRLDLVYRATRRYSPVRSSWDAESGPIRYDVIRGDVASLAFAGDGTVDLGAVICLEDDSHDNDTSGFEDAALPAADRVFFYVYRGSQGTDDGPGSYGGASGDQERVPASGGCPG